jgi:superfamily II DNA helicase RecQ
MVAADKLGTSPVPWDLHYNSLLVARIVIDEAHCIPQLGRDFRYFR